jgi:predicted DNA-binding transcriptional regulator AlpA
MNDDVLFKADLAKALRCSVRTIEQRLSEGGRQLPPQMPSPDKRPRWHRATVDEWKARTKTAHAWRVMHGGR